MLKATVKLNEFEKYQLPKLETLTRPLAEAIHCLASNNARERIGGRFGSEMARTVKTDFTPHGAEVYCASYIAEHVHTGGVVRSKNGKKLAIPIHQLTRRSKEWPREMNDLFAIRCGLKTFLVRESLGNKKKLDFLFVLKSQVQHKPRPWWPDSQEIKQVIDAFFDENFDLKE